VKGRDVIRAIRAVETTQISLRETTRVVQACLIRLCGNAVCHTPSGYEAQNTNSTTQHTLQKSLFHSVLNFKYIYNVIRQKILGSNIYYFIKIFYTFLRNDYIVISGWIKPAV